jgi:protein-S-isoprenylcysteine O-methyltransferase Ste14
MVFKNIIRKVNTSTKKAAAKTASARPQIMTLAFMLLFMTAAAVPVYAAGIPPFIGEAINMLQILVFAIGGGLALWGIINLLEGYGNDNPGAKSQGIKQLMAGGGIALLGTIVPQLNTLFG